MTNNDILRRVRYILDFNDDKMMSIFKSAELEVSRDQLSKWLKKDDDTDFENLNDPQLATFLNGLINEKRGKREGEQPAPEKSLTNNIILRKLMIAFNLKSDDVLKLLELADLRVSKHELSAFFRKPNQANKRKLYRSYRICY